MMQKITYLKSLLLLCALIVGSGTAWAADKWVKTAPADLKTGDVVVIVDQTSSRAMSNNNGTSSAPAATEVTLNDDKSEITSTVADNLQWEVTATDGSYKFGVADTEKYLYCTNSNNGVRVGTNANNAFTITQGGDDDADFLKNTATSRYLGVYDSQYWRCYTSINSNIKATVTAFYKKTSASGPVDPTVTITNTTIPVGGTATIEGPEGLTLSFSSDNLSVATVSAAGIVRGVAVGTAKITASWEAVDDKYNAGSKVFDVTVAAVTVYEKVTNSNQLVAGNEYILVAAENGAAMGKESSKKRAVVSVTVDNDKVAIVDEEVAVLTLGGSADAWTFLASDNSEYLAYSGSSNELHTSSDATADASKWVVTADFQLESANVSGRYLRYNSGSPRFACYTSGQQTAVLFVKEGSATDTKADPELSYTTTSYTVSFDEVEAFVAPTLTNPHSLTVTYASSDENLALVDENTGEVVLFDDTEGTVTITATFAGNAEYKAGSASYSVTIYDPNVKGSYGNPYTVTEVLDGTASGNGVYVKGFITGFITSKDDPVKTSDITSDTNFALSDTEGDTDIANNIGVQLPSGDLRTAWNLKNNDRIGVEVLVKGNIVSYFSKPGVKNTTEIVAVSAPATVGAADYATWVAPFNVEVPSGVEAYYVSNADTKATLSEVISIPAGEPVVLKNAGSFRFNVIDAGELDSPTFGNLLKCDGNIASGDYVLAKHSGSVGFYKWTGSAALPANQVYLPATSGSAEYDFISLDVDGIETGINAIASELKGNAEVYNLNGQRVAQPTKGLYIVNGKKYVIK